MKYFGMNLENGKLVHWCVCYEKGDVIIIELAGKLNRKSYDVAPGTISLFPVLLFLKLTLWRIKRLMKRILLILFTA